MCQKLISRGPSRLREPLAFREEIQSEVECEPRMMGALTGFGGPLALQALEVAIGDWWCVRLRAKATTLVESILPNLCLQRDRTISGVDKEVLWLRPREDPGGIELLPGLPGESMGTRGMDLGEDELIVGRFSKDRWSNATLKKSKSVTLADPSVANRGFTEGSTEPCWGVGIVWGSGAHRLSRSSAIPYRPALPDCVAIFAAQPKRPCDCRARSAGVGTAHPRRPRLYRGVQT
jgi:hypothetical protein